MEDLKARWATVFDSVVGDETAGNTPTKISTADINTILLKIHQHELNIANAKAKRDEEIAYFQKFIDNAKQNYDIDIAEDVYHIGELKKVLQAYFDANPPVGRKNHKFAAGSFGYNKAQTKFFFNGNEANANNPEFVNYCCCVNGLPQFIKVKEYLDWANLKKSLDADDNGNVYLASTGELIHELRAQKVFSVKTV